VPPLIEELDAGDAVKGSRKILYSQRLEPAVEEAISALGKIADPRAVGPLIELLARQKQEWTSHVDGPGHSGPVTRRRTFWESTSVEKALIQIGGPSVRPLLDELEGSRYNTRCGAIRVLGRLRDRRAVEPLVRALDDQDKEIRVLAAAALAEIGDGRAVRPLLEMVGPPWGPDSWAARDALSTLSLDAIDPLISALDDDNHRIRQHAAEALREIGEPRALDAINAR
jgi:HEAT repeat protein